MKKKETITLFCLWHWAPTNNRPSCARKKQTIFASRECPPRIEVAACLAPHMKPLPCPTWSTFFSSSTIPRGMDFKNKWRCRRLYSIRDSTIFFSGRPCASSPSIVPDRKGKKQRDTGCSHTAPDASPAVWEWRKIGPRGYFPLRILFSVRKRKEQNAAVYLFFSTGRK